MKLLIKYPSRSRPERFFDGLDSIYRNISDMDNFRVACTLDVDDESMHNAEVIDKIGKYRNVSIQWGTSESKVHAINRDLPDYGDIIVVYSDDMRTDFYGFDEIIRNAFKEHFPDLDGMIHLPDQDTKAILATMYIAGRPFYKRFGHIYPPQYKSLWCDNHMMAVAKILNRYAFIDCPGVVTHLLPAMGWIPKDEMFIRQQLDWDRDEAIFRENEANNFYL
jgi:hypothetical protein